jgi:hypothetical protein
MSGRGLIVSHTSGLGPESTSQVKEILILFLSHRTGEHPQRQTLNQLSSYLTLQASSDVP